MLTIAGGHVNMFSVLLVAIGLPLPFVLPFLFFRHAKSLWMSIDFMVHPVDVEERGNLPPHPSL